MTRKGIMTFALLLLASRRSPAADGGNAVESRALWRVEAAAADPCRSARGLVKLGEIHVKHGEFVSGLAAFRKAFAGSLSCKDAGVAESIPSRVSDAYAAASLALKADPVRLGIVGFSADVGSAAPGYADSLASAFAGQPGVLVLEPTRSDAVLAERGLRISGALDEAKLIEAGRMLEASLVLHGSVRRAGGEILAEASARPAAGTDEAFSCSHRGPVSDPYGVQAGLAAACARALRTYLAASEAERRLAEPGAGPGPLDWFEHGVFVWRRARFAEAEEDFRRAIALRPLDGFRLRLGDLLEAAGEPARALELYQQMAKETLKESGISRPMLHDRIGTSFQALGRFEEAIRELNAGIKLLDPAKDQQRLERSFMLSNLAVVYEGRSLYPQALESLYKALADARAVRNPSQITRMLLNLGLILSAQKDFDRAAARFSEAMESLGAEVSPSTIYDVLEARAEFEFNRRKWPLASFYFERCIALAEGLRRAGPVPRLKLNAGMSLLSSGRVEAAVPHLEDFLLSKPEPATRDYFAAHVALGTALANLREFPRAVRLIESAREGARAAGDRRSEHLAVERLAAFHRAAGNAKAALGFEREAADLAARYGLEVPDAASR